MSINNHHAILRSRIEIITDSYDNNKPLEDAIYATVEKHLRPILSKLFSQYIPTDLVIHLDQLVIDVGCVNLCKLKEQLPHKIEYHLISVLKQQIKKVMYRPTCNQVMPLPVAKIQAIAHYLSEGSFAWWMPECSEKQIEKLYLELLHQHPLLIEEFWYNLQKKEKVMQRFIARFSTTTIEDTLSILLKQPILYFTPILSEMGINLHKIGILKDSRYTLQRQLLLAALLGIIKQPGSKINRLVFLTLLLKQIAAKTSTSYPDILNILQEYYVQNDKKSSSNFQEIPTRSLIFQLYDMTAMVPKFWYQEVKNKETILKKLDGIGNGMMTSYQLLETIKGIQAQIYKPEIHILIKSWLREQKNNMQLVQKLPDTIFSSFISSIAAPILAIFSDLSRVIKYTTIAPLCAIKEATLAYYAFDQDQVTYLKQIRSLLYRCIMDVGIDKNRLEHLRTTAKECYTLEVETMIRQLVSQMENHLKLACDQTDILQVDTTYKNQLIPKLHCNVTPTSLVVEEVQVVQNIFSLHHVVDFLVNDILPQDQLVPAYLIAQSVGRAAPKQICYYLAPLCQDPTILQKLMLHVTEGILGKLLQAFIPFSKELLNELEVIIIQSKVFQEIEYQANIRLIQQILITAAIAHKPPVTEYQYIERVMLNLGSRIQLSPVILCERLFHTVTQLKYNQLIEPFYSLKKRIGLLNPSKIDAIELTLLSMHEAISMQLDQKLLLLYYGRLLPSVKNMVAKSLPALYQSEIQKLVTQHLPTLSEIKNKAITTLLASHIKDIVKSKNTTIMQKWKLFLHTGRLGNDANVVALWEEVMQYAPSFYLEEVVAQQHVRQRLITHFTHTQLLLLLQRHSHFGKEMTTYLQGIYQLWCATQSSLGIQSITKNIFWDIVLEILSHFSSSSFNKTYLVEQLLTNLSKALQIAPTTLLQTFKLLISEHKEVSEVESLTSLLNDLQIKYQHGLYKPSIQNNCKLPVLRKLHLLLNGGLSLFAERYDAVISELENELVQLILEKPYELLIMLTQQSDKYLVSRGIVYYFSKEFSIKIVMLLSKEKQSFVVAYLRLLSNPMHHEVRNYLSIWEKELSISIINYLLTTDSVNEAAFVQTTLFGVYYEKEMVGKIIASVIAISPVNQMEEAIVVLLRSGIKLSDQNIANHTTAEDAPLLFLGKNSLKTNRKGEGIDLKKQEVRVYTKNTGLVFLWPFLYDFFKVQSLLVGNIFSCEQAVHNAVYILQYLITGNLNSPEWQLTLPKLLCGLPYDEVLLPYCHIDQAYDADASTFEIENTMVEWKKSLKQLLPNSKKREKGGSIAEHLSIGIVDTIELHSQEMMHKVLKRWKNLEKLKTVNREGITTDFFKNYFLNRLGILFRQPTDDLTEKKAWHLTIMQQDYDQLDLLPPWSMTKVKLTWMQEEIILFWMPT